MGGALFRLGVAIAAAMASAPALAETTFQSGKWKGAPYFNGQQFSHCYVNIGYPDGTQLYLQLTAQMVLYVGAAKSNWSMDPTKQYDVSFQFANGYKKSFTGRVGADRRNAIWFTIGNDSELRNALATNASMTWIDSQGVRFPFDLTGGDNAMRKLLACTALYGTE